MFHSTKENIPLHTCPDDSNSALASILSSINSYYYTNYVLFLYVPLTLALLKCMHDILAYGMHITCNNNIIIMVNGMA